ncbi:DUF4244 domain-containing protein [Cellulomonas sp. P5_C6]
MTIDATGTRPEDPHDDDPTPGGGPAARPVAPVRTAGLAPHRRRPVLPRTVLAWHAQGRHAREELAEAGMATAEYAIATLAAVGFAGLLVVILKGNEVRGLLTGIIRQALSL